MKILEFNIPDWFWVAFNLLVLVLVLRKILWKRVFSVLEERQETVVKTMLDAEEAERLRVEMEQLRTELDEELDAKTALKMQEARTRAGKEYDRIVAEAEAKAAIIIKAAKTKAGQERHRLMVEMKGQVAATAVEAAGLLLRANMDSDRNRLLLENFLSEGDISA